MRAVSIFLLDSRYLIIGIYWLRKDLHALLNSHEGINFAKAPTQHAATDPIRVPLGVRSENPGCAALA
jgi:hypothetical protein